MVTNLFAQLYNASSFHYLEVFHPKFPHLSSQEFPSLNRVVCKEEVRRAVFEISPLSHLVLIDSFQFFSSNFGI